MRHRGSRRRRTQKRHRMNGGTADVAAEAPVNVGDSSADSPPSLPMAGGKGRRGGRRSSGKSGRAADRNGGRGKKGGFFENLGSAIHQAIVPFGLLYAVTRKNRGKRGGRDDVA